MPRASPSHSDADGLVVCGGLRRDGRNSLSWNTLSARSIRTQVYAITSFTSRCTGTPTGMGI